MADIYTKTPLSLRVDLTVLLDVIVYHIINFKVINSAHLLPAITDLPIFVVLFFENNITRTNL